MKKQPGSILVLLMALVAFSSCGDTYKKTKSGLLYKIVGSSSDALVKEGNILKFNYQIKLSSTDSVLQTSYGKAPGYFKVNPPNNMQMGQAYNPIEVFPFLHNGDSVIVVQLVDSLSKKNPMEPLPPFLKKGDKIITTFKVLKVFTADSSAMADNQLEQNKDRARQEAEHAGEIAKRRQEAEADLKTQVPALEKWLADKKIATQKTGRGVFVVLTDPGSGALADSGQYATVRYTGKSLSDGKVFQSTMDPQARPFTFVVGTGGAIPGWDDALKLFKKGGKGTIYIPAALAYGKNPPPGSGIKPDDALAFDIAVEDVSDTPPQQQQPQQQAPPPPSAPKKK